MEAPRRTQTSVRCACAHTCASAFHFVPFRPFRFFSVPFGPFRPPRVLCAALWPMKGRPHLARTAERGVVGALIVDPQAPPPVGDVTAGAAAAPAVACRRGEGAILGA